MMTLPQLPELMGTQSAVHEYASCSAASRHCAGLPPQPSLAPSAGASMASSAAVSSPATPEHSTAEAAGGGAASPSSITYLSGCSAPSPTDARVDRAGSTSSSSELQSMHQLGALQALLLAPQLGAVAPSSLPLLPPPTGAQLAPQLQQRIPAHLQQQVARQQQQLQLQVLLKSQLQLQQQQQVKKRQLVPLSAADAPKGATSTMLVLAPPSTAEPRPAAAVAPAADPSFSAGFAAGVLQGLATQTALHATGLQGGVQKKAGKQRQRQGGHAPAASKPSSPQAASRLGATHSSPVPISTLPAPAAAATAAAPAAAAAAAAASAIPSATAVAMCCSISDLLGASSSGEAAVRLSKLSREELFQFARQAVGGACTPAQIAAGCCGPAATPAVAGPGSVLRAPGGSSSCVPGACTPAQIAAGCCTPAQIAAGCCGPAAAAAAGSGGSISSSVSTQGVQAVPSISGVGSTRGPLMCTPEQMLAGCCTLEQVASGQCILVPSPAAGTASRRLPQPSAAAAPASPCAGTGPGTGAGLAAAMGTAFQPSFQALMLPRSNSSRSEPLPKLCTPEQLAAGGCCSPEQVLSGSCLLVEADELAARLAAIGPGCSPTAAVAAPPLPSAAAGAGCCAGRSSSSAVLPPAVELMAFYSQLAAGRHTPFAAPPAAVAADGPRRASAGVGPSMQPPLLQNQLCQPPQQSSQEQQPQQQQYGVLADMSAEPLPSYEDLYLSWQQEQEAADGMDWAGHDLGLL